MYNYNLINPINITYRNQKHDPYSANKGDKTSANENNAPVNPDGKGQRHFPNGNKVQIDYTKNKVNIAQVIEDFKSTIAAINAPEDITKEVNAYLGLVEAESKKENPSREIILSNLKNASKISDKFIQDSLKKPSTVVEDWVNALFLQHVELKSNPDFINEAFRVQIPDKKGTKTQEGHSEALSNNTPGINIENSDKISVYQNISTVNEADKSPNNPVSLDIVSKTDDISTSINNVPLKIYDIPQNRITINEIKPIGQADINYFIEDVQPENKNISAPQSQQNEDFIDFKEVEAQLQIAQDFENKNLTYSTAAAKIGVLEPDAAAVSFENQVYKISTASDDVEKIINNTAENATSKEVRTLSDEEKNARKNFVRAKRIIKENGSPLNAIKLYNEALNMVQNSDNSNLKAAIHFERGVVYDDYDHVELALKDYNSATKCTDNNLKTHAHLKMGRIYDDYVMFNPAVEHYSLALEFSEEAGNPGGKTKALRHLAGLFADRFDKNNTETFNNLAVDAAYETGNLKTVANTLREAAQNFEYVGEDTKALKMYKQAAKVLYNSKDYLTLSKNYEDAYSVMDRLGNEAKAMSLLSKALLYHQKAELQSDLQATQA